MATSKRFSARHGLDNNSNTIQNVADPVNAQDAATKAFSSNASNLDSGTVDAARLPAFTGDATSTAGTSALTLANSGVTAGTYKSVTVDVKGRVTAGTNPTTLAGYGITDAVSSSLIGAASGIVPLGADSKIATTYLPSYVDDVLEYSNLAGFPATGETGKIYVALDTNKTYRWSGSAYVYITSGAVDSVAGKTGVVTLAVADVSGLQTALDSKANTVTTYTKTEVDAAIAAVSGGSASTDGIVWSAPITSQVTSTVPASTTYWYPAVVSGGGPLYVYISVTNTAAASQTSYHKTLLLISGRGQNAQVIANSYGSSARVNQATILYGNTSNYGKTAVRLNFTTRPTDATVSISFGYPKDNAAVITNVNTWSSSTSLPTTYTNEGISTTNYSSGLSSVGSQITASYATSAGSANSATSASTASYADYAKGLQHEFGNWSYGISGNNPQNGQVLAYNSSSMRWEPANAGGSSGVTNIIAGTGITISSTGANGTGAVTINATGGGGSSSNPPPGGSFGATLSTGSSLTTGYIPFPSEYSITGSWSSATLTVLIAVTDASPPTSTPSGWSYLGALSSFTVGGSSTVYVHAYRVENSSFISIDPSGFYVSGLPPVSASCCVFTSSSSISGGNAGYINVYSSMDASTGNPISFPAITPPGSGTLNVFDSKQIVFYPYPDTLTAIGSGVTLGTPADGPIRVVVANVPKALISISPTPSQTTVSGSNPTNQICGVRLLGYSYTS